MGVTFILSHIGVHHAQSGKQAQASQQHIRHVVVPSTDSKQTDCIECQAPPFRGIGERRRACSHAEFGHVQRRSERGRVACPPRLAPGFALALTMTTLSSTLSVAFFVAIVIWRRSDVGEE